MIQDAIIKINAEIQADPADMYLEAIGHHVIDACATEQAAAAILAEGKTLKGAMSEVRAAAQKKAKGGVAVMRDEDVYAIVDKYFGIEGAPAPAPAPAPAAKAGISLDIGDFF